MQFNQVAMTGLFFGLTTVDLQLLVPRYPGPNDKIKAEKNGIYAGGPAANAAIAFAFAGGSAKLYSAIGDHPLRSFILQDIETTGVEVTDLIPEKKTEPVFASIITTKNTGERTIFSYHPALEVQPHALNGNRIETPSISMFDGFYMDAAIAVAKKMKAQNIPVVFDGGSWKEGTEELLSMVDIAICSHDFYPPGTSTKKQVVSYLEAKNIEKIAITRGDKPVLFKTNEHSGEIYVEEKPVVDTLGAGDFFHGAFCFYYANGNDFVESLRKAAIMATQSCTEFGTRKWMNKERK